MKRPAAYYLLLLYCTVLMRCALPVACDALSHIFNEENHIATVHAMFGNDHVEKEIATQEKDSNKNQTGIKFEDQIAVHLSVEAIALCPDVKNSNSLFSVFRLLKVTSIFLSQPLPPPKFS